MKRKNETAREYKARRRLKLFKQQDGRCHWCDCDMVLPPDGQHIKRQPPNLGTIEHLRDRFDPSRTVPARGEARWVLACLACNNKRGAEQQAAVGIEELRRRSGHYRGLLFAVDKKIGTQAHNELQAAHDAARTEAA